jgi:hypothetical protein
MKTNTGGEVARDQRLKEAGEGWRRELEDASTFAEALGHNLAEARRRRRRTTEQIAQAARGYGLTWHRTTVGQTEAGKRSLTAAELFLLPAIYEESLPDLMPEGTTWLTDEVAVWSGELWRTITERDHRPALAPGKWALRNPVTAGEVAETVARLGREWPHDALLKHMQDAPDEAETKAAKKLQTTPHYVAYTARELWGHGLAAERDARLAKRPGAPAGGRALQAARGHVTRTLIVEMEPRVREHETHRHAG